MAFVVILMVKSATLQPNFHTTWLWCSLKQKSPLAAHTKNPKTASAGHPELEIHCNKMPRSWNKLSLRVPPWKYRMTNTIIGPSHNPILTAILIVTNMLVIQYIRGNRPVCLSEGKCQRPTVFLKKSSISNKQSQQKMDKYCYCIWTLVFVIKATGD